MEYKTCAHCKEEKPLSEFKESTGSYYRELSQRTGKTYLISYCNPCDRLLMIERQKKTYRKKIKERLKYQKKYYQKNIEKEKAYQKEYYQRPEIKIYMKEYLKKWYERRKLLSI